jgi:hypothetical protein
MLRYETIIGRRLQARTLSNQTTEAKLGCNVLSRMAGPGMPVSARVSCYARGTGEATNGGSMHQRGSASHLSASPVGADSVWCTDHVSMESSRADPFVSQPITRAPSKHVRVVEADSNCLLRSTGQDEGPWSRPVRDGSLVPLSS